APLSRRASTTSRLEGSCVRSGQTLEGSYLTVQMATSLLPGCSERADEGVGSAREGRPLRAANCMPPPEAGAEKPDEPSPGAACSAEVMDSSRLFTGRYAMEPWSPGPISRARMAICSSV